MKRPTILKIVTLTASAAFAVALGFDGAAQAQLTKFTDETAFVDASGAVMIAIPDSDTAFPATTCGDDIVPPHTGRGTSLTIAFDSNELTVTQEPLATNGLCIFDPEFIPDLDNTNPNDSVVPLLVAAGEDDYKIVFDTPVAAIGFLLLTNSSSAETVTLKDSSGAVIDSAQDISGDTPNNGRQFIGFTSTVPIKTVIFGTTGGATQNEGFEGFKAATFPPLSKELTSGPHQIVDGALTDVPNPAGGFLDAGQILINHDKPQHFSFKIEVFNNSGSGQSVSRVISDVIPKIFNLSEDREQLADGCADGTCDGIMLDSTGNACAVQIVDTKDVNKALVDVLAAETMLVIDCNNLAAGGTATLTVWLETKKGSKKRRKFQPTACIELANVGGTPINEWVTLNPGVKEYGLGGSLLSGPPQPIQLRPISATGCSVAAP